jgi:hypothetical protein
MAITLTGTAGCQFAITTADSADATGTKTVLHQTEAAIRSVTFTNASKSIAYTGSVGTVGTDIDLFSNVDVNDGTYTLRISSGTSAVSITGLLCICVHNKSAGNITVSPGSSNSFLAASEQITIPAGGAWMMSYSTAATVSNTVKTIKLTGAAVDYACEIYVLGN